jgi:rhodanese-related sulfurtransferase
MEQLIEFAGNHPMLSGGFVAVLLLLVWTELSRKVQGLTELSPAQAVPWMNQNDCVVIDVSASSDFNSGHIVDARNIPPSRLAKADADLRKLIDRNILVVDKNGQTAASAAASLKKLGASQVAILKGGMAQWKSDQYPVTKKK